MRPNLSVEFLWRLSLTILLVSAITSTSTAAVLKRNSTPIFNSTIGEEKQQICNAPIYGSCLKRANPSSRPCTYYNRCNRLNRMKERKLPSPGNRGQFASSLLVLLI
ncbi:hypothetical protein OIU78_026231 [Salix suchowensis]|nr:hypothetical protein OIU78_026231 [Salix suchowensis]